MKKLVLTLLAGLLSSAFSCSSVSSYPHGGPYYYKSFASYQLPHRPVNELSKEEALELEKNGYAYYIAHFNNSGQIVSFEKIYKGKMEFKFMYFYANGILVKGEKINAGGTTEEILVK